MHRFKKPLFLIWLFHKKLFKYLFITFISLVILTLILSGIFTGVLYYANAHGQLHKWLNSSINTVQISYNTAHVSWDWGDPSLSLTGVEIMAPQAMTQPLKFDSISIDLGIWSSILHRQLVTSNITVSGLNFDIIQEETGGFIIAGFNMGKGEASSFTFNPALADWFLAQREIYLNNIHLNVTLRNAQKLNMHIEELSWIHHFDYNFKIKGSILQIPNSHLELDANLNPGDSPMNLNDWSANFDGFMLGKDFTPLLGQTNLADLAWLSGGGSIQFNGAFSHQALQYLDLYLALENVNIGHHPSTTSLLTSNFDEAILWKSKRQGAWQLIIKPVHDDNYIPSTVDITYNPVGENTWQVKGQDIDLAMLGQWIDFWFPPDTYVSKTWRFLNLSGMLTNLNIAIGPKGGSANLSSKDLALGKNALFPQGWPATNVTMNTNWKLSQDQKTLAIVNINALNLENSWLSFALSGNVQIPKVNPANALLDVKGTFIGHNLEEVKANYIPRDFVDKGLSEWLSQGLVKIPKATGNFIWQGRLEEMPYNKAKGLFQIAVHTTDTTIQPWQGWPLISNITADLLFKNQNFTIDSNQATTAGVPIHEVHFTTDFAAQDKKIVIKGEATPTAEQGLNYLTLMPIIGKNVDTWLKSIQVTGSLPLHLEVDIPIHEHEPILAMGDMTFTKNNWSLSKGGDSLLSNITGKLHFENDKISVDSANFDALNQNLTVHILLSPLDHLRIIVKSFLLLGQTFEHLEMDVTAGEEGTLLTFIHPLVNGALTIQGGNAALVGHFKNFTLPLLSGTNSDAAAQSKIGKLATKQHDPQKEAPVLLGLILNKIPALNLTIENLDYGKNDLGEFFWESQPIPSGINIKHINLTSKNIRLNVAGEIQTLADQDHFSANGVLSSEDYGALLTSLNYPNMMTEGSGQIHFDLSWVAEFLNINFATMNGSVHFDLADGKLLQVNAGFARIFSIVSLDTIFSTLSLNFQKMLSSGLIFDSITGGYIIQNGVASANEDGVRIAGPSLNMTLRGEMDLANQTLNQTATVMPQVGNSIAIAAAVVGGPIAGVATWFADKLLSNTILRNAGVNLKITGSFNKPVVSLFNQPTANS